MRASPRRAWGRSTLAIGRARCRLRWFDLGHVPEADRAAALRLQALAWQPFDTTEHALRLQGERGLAIAWDGKALADALTTQPATRTAEAWPELCLRDALPDGLHLLTEPEGVELQLWRGGELQASRWWSQPPDAKELALVAAPLGEPVPQQATPAPGWRKRGPAGWLRAQAPAASAAGQRWVLWAGAALALCGGFVVAQVVQVERALSAQTSRNESLKADVAPVLAQREQALGAAATLAPWALALRSPAPIELLQHLQEPLARLSVRVREFEWQASSATLRLGLVVPQQLPRGELFKALQTGGWLRDVSEARGPSVAGISLWVEAKVDGVDPPALRVVAPAPVAAPQPTPAQPLAAAAPAAPAPSPAPPIARAPGASRPAAATPPSDLPPQSVFDAIK